MSWRYFYIKLTFKSIDQVNQIIFRNMGGLIQSVEVFKRKKTEVPQRRRTSASKSPLDLQRTSARTKESNRRIPLCFTNNRPQRLVPSSASAPIDWLWGSCLALSSVSWMTLLSFQNVSSRTAGVIAYFWCVHWSFKHSYHRHTGHAWALLVGCWVGKWGIGRWEEDKLLVGVWKQ